jgi:hypothetical protein
MRISTKHEKAEALPFGYGDTTIRHIFLDDSVSRTPPSWHVLVRRSNKVIGGFTINLDPIFCKEKATKYLKRSARSTYPQLPSAMQQLQPITLPKILHVQRRTYSYCLLSATFWCAMDPDTLCSRVRHSLKPLRLRFSLGHPRVTLFYQQVLPSH